VCIELTRLLVVAISSSSGADQSIAPSGPAMNPSSDTFIE